MSSPRSAIIDAVDATMLHLLTPPPGIWFKNNALGKDSMTDSVAFA
jgi:hypothetical protein